MSETFCRNCGTKLNYATSTCPNCKRTHSSPPHAITTHFPECRYCGKVISMHAGGVCDYCRGRYR
jgi:hypothetical protein